MGMSAPNMFPYPPHSKDLLLYPTHHIFIYLKNLTDTFNGKIASLEKQHDDLRLILSCMSNFPVIYLNIFQLVILLLNSMKLIPNCKNSQNHR